MSDVKYSREQVVEAAAKVVAERGADWVYPKERGSEWLLENEYCRYALPDGSPACIVGAIFHELGIKNDPDYQGGVRNYVSALGILDSFDDKTVDSLNDAQIEQDTGTAWGEAIVEAFPELKN